MGHRFEQFGPRELLQRALEEDHAALTASCDEAAIAHRALATLMREAADRSESSKQAVDSHER